MSALIKISNGELVDRVTILRLKAERLSDPAAVQGVTLQLVDLHFQLKSIRENCPCGVESFDAAMKEIQEINTQLWDLENTVRQEKNAAIFTLAAWRIFELNDRRAKVKRDIDRITGSSLTDYKEHKA